jgi:type IV secretory pathway VirB2 component (pilin)
MKKSNLYFVALFLMLLALSDSALAADEMGDGICKVVTLLTGKWLFGFTILATLGAGAALLFGGEMTDGLKKIATIISIVGIILATSSLLSMAFSKFGGVTC